MQIFYLGSYLYFGQINIFSLITSPISNLEIQCKMQNQRKCYFFVHRLNELYETLYSRQIFGTCVLSLIGRMTPNSAAIHEFKILSTENMNFLINLKFSHGQLRD